MSKLIALYTANMGITHIVIASLALLSLLWHKHSTIALQLKARWYMLPIIGRNARLAKNLGIDNAGWFASEQAVCESFKPHYEKYLSDQEHFEQSCKYLNKVGDSDVKPMSAWLWGLLALMVVTEAAGFGYVLANFTIIDGSEQVQQLATAGIALVISVLLLFLTHAMGKELYRNSQIRKLRSSWSNSNTQHRVIEPNNRVSLRQGTNHLDDHDSYWQQMANRLAKVNSDFSASWWLSTLTTLLIASVAAGATYVRGQALERASINEIAGLEATEQTHNPFASLNPFDLPEEVVELNRQTDQVAIEQSIQAHNKGGWATFIVLAVIFVFMQIFSIYLGFKSSFSGKESANAYQKIHKFSNVNDYLADCAKKQEYVIDIAQRVLVDLQTRLEKRASKHSAQKNVVHATKTASHRTFVTYRNQQDALYASFQSPALNNTSASYHEENEIEATHIIDQHIIRLVENGQIDGLSDEQVIAAMRYLHGQQETSEQRLLRLQQQAQCA